MTNLPQTISKRVSIITGKEVPLGCVDLEYPRATGRTTAIALHSISTAMKSGSYLAFDHNDYPACGTQGAATNLCNLILQIIDILGMEGFTVEVAHHPSALRNNGSKYWGVLIQFSPYKEVFYDLRK